MNDALQYSDIMACPLDILCERPKEEPSHEGGKIHNFQGSLSSAPTVIRPFGGSHWLFHRIYCYFIMIPCFFIL